MTSASVPFDSVPSASVPFASMPSASRPASDRPAKRGLLRRRTVDPAAAPGTAKPKKRQRSRPGWIVAIVFAFLFALDAFQGLSNLIGLNQSFQAVGVAMPGNALAALVGLIVAPLVVYGLVLWGTRRLRAGTALLVFLVGFAVAAVVTLDLQSVYRSIVPFIIPV